MLRSALVSMQDVLISLKMSSRLACSLEPSRARCYYMRIPDQSMDAQCIVAGCWS